MEFGNFPKDYTGKEGKIYWRLSVGSHAVPSRYFTDGWRAFEFVVLKPFMVVPPGAMHPYAIRIAFAYWLPFYTL